MTQKSALISLLSDRPVAYHPSLARILGGVKQAIFVSQLLYWTDKGKRPDGFIWKTQAEWTDETGLSAGEQRTARKHLVEQGILYEKLRGIPAKLHYKLDLDKLQASIEDYYVQDVGIHHILMDETPRTITESTPEITTENTTERPSSSDDDFSDLFQKPDRPPITTNLPESAHGPLDLAAKTAQARAKEKQWTTPQAEDWAATYSAFCLLFPMSNPDDQPDKKRDNWTHEIKRLAVEVHATPEQAIAAIKAVARLEQWMIKPSTTPFKSSWAEAFQNTIIMKPDALAGLLKGQASHRNNGNRSYENVPGAYIDDGNNPLGIDLSIFQEPAEAPA